VAKTRYFSSNLALNLRKEQILATAHKKVIVPIFRVDFRRFNNDYFSNFQKGRF
jgi:hypothetical protein